MYFRFRAYGATRGGCSTRRCRFPFGALFVPLGGGGIVALNRVEGCYEKEARQGRSPVQLRASNVFTGGSCCPGFIRRNPLDRLLYVDGYTIDLISNHVMVGANHGIVDVMSPRKLSKEGENIGDNRSSRCPLECDVVCLVS